MKQLEPRRPTLAFEQQHKESAKAFAAFSLYLSLGPDRSLAAVGRKLGKSVVLLQRWSRRWDWAGRVAAYAAHLAAAEREATAALVRAKAAEWLKRDEALREQEWETRAEAVALRREAIARWKANGNRCGSLEGIARLLELGSTLGHRATGTPLERVEVTGENGGPIRVEFEAALRKVYGPVVDVEAVPVPPKEIKEGA
jgi:hypothetical protein